MAIGGAYGAGLGSVGDKMTQVIETMTLNATFRGGFFIGLLFLLFLLLNMWRERFWCRYVCPTGAFLGLASKLSLFKLKVDEEACIKCNLCSIHCPTQAKPFPIGEWKSSECIYCETCAAICPTKAITFPPRLRPERAPKVDLTKRKLILTSALAFLSVPFFRISQARKRASDKLLRPPGSLPEKEFLARCVKCGECMKACPTNALQPALTEAGPEGMWTPVLVPKIGYCEYYCSLCSQVCPTGAIKELTVPEKTDGQDRHGLDRQEPLPALLPGPAVHRLRGALPDLAQGHPVHRVRVAAARRHHGRQQGAGHRRQAVHRLRHLREQVPGDGPAGHLRDQRRRAPLQGEPAAAGYLKRAFFPSPGLVIRPRDGGHHT